MTTKKPTGVRQRHTRSCTRARGCRCVWEWVAEGATVAGQRTQASKSGYETMAAAKRARAEFIAKGGPKRGTAAKTLTFADWVERWLELRKTSAHDGRKLKASTLDSYADLSARYLVPVSARGRSARSPATRCAPASR